MKNCKNCSKAIWCPTWAEHKCVETEVRYSAPVEDCEGFVKRPENWKEMKCRCEDCQKNDLLDVEIEEGVDA